MKILGQRQQPWASQKLGFGNTTIHDYGCTITSLAMLLNTTPDVVNEKLKKVNGFVGDNKNLIVWTKIKEAFSYAEFIWREYNYNDEADNLKVKDAIEKYGGCLVEVDFDNSLRTDGKHWILLVGNKKMYDPWTGTERPTSDYSIYTGYSIIKIDKNLQGDTMADCLLTNTEDNRKLWEKLVTNSGKYDAFVSQGFNNPSDVQTKIAQLEGDIKGRDETIKSLNQVISDKNGKLSVLESQINTNESKLIDQETRINSLIEQAKKIPVLQEEHEHLLSQRSIWIETEKTYNRTIGQLKSENESLRNGAVNTLINIVFTKVKESIINFVNGYKKGKNG